MLSCNKSPENEISGRAEHTSFCSFYFMNSNGGKRKKIEKEFHRNYKYGLAE